MNGLLVFIEMKQKFKMADTEKKQAKNAFFVFLGCFLAYVGQPHN